MPKHHTQLSRSAQMQKLKDIIVKYGGVDAIDKSVGRRPFTYFIAEELSCTYEKAREYIEIAIQSTIARARMKQMYEGSNP